MPSCRQAQLTGTRPPDRPSKRTRSREEQQVEEGEGAGNTDDSGEEGDERPPTGAEGGRRAAGEAEAQKGKALQASAGGSGPGHQER